MSNSLLYSFGKITEKSRYLGVSQVDMKTSEVNEFISDMDDLFLEIKKSDKRKNFFKMLFL